MELEIIESNRQGFKGIWPEGPRKGQLGRQYSNFIAPGLIYHDLTSEKFGRTLTAVYATPIRQGECRLFARFPFKFNSKLPKFFIKLTPTWYSHINQNAILEDDQFSSTIKSVICKLRGIVRILVKLVISPQSGFIRVRVSQLG